MTSIAKRLFVSGKLGLLSLVLCGASSTGDCLPPLSQVAEASEVADAVLTNLEELISIASVDTGVDNDQLALSALLVVDQSTNEVQARLKPLEELIYDGHKNDATGVQMDICDTIGKAATGIQAARRRAGIEAHGNLGPENSLFDDVEMGLAGLEGLINCSQLNSPDEFMKTINPGKLLKGTKRIHRETKVMIRTLRNNPNFTGDTKLINFLLMSSKRFDQTVSLAEESVDLDMAGSFDASEMKFALACNKIASARSKLYLAKKIQMTENNPNIEASDIEEQRDDIKELRNEVGCP